MDMANALGRSLWYLRRYKVYTCDVCGRPHVHHEIGTDYRAVEIASEPLSDDAWEPLADSVVFSVDEDHYLLIESLAKYTGTTLF